MTFSKFPSWSTWLIENFNFRQERMSTIIPKQYASCVTEKVCHATLQMAFLSAHNISLQRSEQKKYQSSRQWLGQWLSNNFFLMNPFLTEIKRKAETKIFKSSESHFYFRIYIYLINLIFTKFFVFRNCIHYVWFWTVLFPKSLKISIHECHEC